jgi:hypothetical protein
MYKKAGEGAGASIIAEGKARVFNPNSLRKALLTGILFARVACIVAADTDDVAQGRSDSSCPFLNYFSDWFMRVDQTRAEQPHWSPPVYTVSPNLQEVLRYDIMDQSLAGGRTLANFGSGKGVEFIPAEHIQFIVGIPPRETENTRPDKNGWGDESFLMKYRFLSANEQNGNYVLTGFLGLTVPNGSANYTTHHFVFAPTIAGGKGWGDFNLQGTAGVSVPDNQGGRNTLGTPLALNLTAQYKLVKIIWPEVEANYTYWPNGTREGINQLFITPGLVLGKIPLWNRLGIMVGVGCQIAVTDRPLYHRNLLLTARMPF